MNEKTEVFAEQIAQVKKALGEENEIKAIVCPESSINGIELSPLTVGVKCHRSTIKGSDWRRMVLKAKELRKNLGLSKSTINPETGDLVAGSMLAVKPDGISFACVLLEKPVNRDFLYSANRNLNGLSVSLVLPSHTHQN